MDCSAFFTAESIIPKTHKNISDGFVQNSSDPVLKEMINTEKFSGLTYPPHN